MAETEQRTRVISTMDLATELRRVLRRGLPAEQRTVGEVLPHIRNVVARAVHPDDLLSRVDAFNGLLTRVLGEMEDERLGQAARILFGIADGSAGTTLTLRRQRAAQLLEYDVDHFRKRVEARILYQAAEALHRDLVRYRARTRRSTYAYEISRPTPALTPEEITSEDELLCRIWQHLYELRAERIAGHLAENPMSAQSHREAAEAAAKQLRELTDEFVDRYGRQFISDGQLDYAVQGLEKLVLWRTGVTDPTPV
jgi:hypothetical protein